MQNSRTRQSRLLRLIIAGIMIALAQVLPLLIGDVQIMNQGISPMHIPAFIAGFTCGPLWGAVVGVVSPLLRGAIFGKPVFPVGSVPMAFELAVYGAVCGGLYLLLRRRKPGSAHLPLIYIALVAAMLLGRCAGGVGKVIVTGMQGNGYAFSTFIAAYFTGTAVGAVIHLILVPAVVTALERAKLSPLDRELK